MAESKLVAMLFDAWDDLDRAYKGVTAEEATARPEGEVALAARMGALAAGYGPPRGSDGLDVLPAARAAELDSIAVMRCRVVAA